MSLSIEAIRPSFRGDAEGASAFLGESVFKQLALLLEASLLVNSSALRLPSFFPSFFPSGTMEARRDKLPSQREF